MGYWGTHPLAGDLPLDNVAVIEQLLMKKLTESDFDALNRLLAEPYPSLAHMVGDRCFECFFDEAVKPHVSAVMRRLFYENLDQVLALEEAPNYLPFLICEREWFLSEELFDAHAAQLDRLVGDGGASERGYSGCEEEGPHRFAELMRADLRGFLTGARKFPDDPGLLSTIFKHAGGLANTR